jgi:hypothetical protein
MLYPSGLKTALQLAEHYINNAISLTPTSEIRNDLTDINLKLLELKIKIEDEEEKQDA